MEPLNRDFVTDDSAAVRELLEGLQQGDSSALDLLIGILYEELRVIAHNQRRRWRGDDTLGTTALLHEAYAKLRHQRRISIESRSHFLALASRAMRHILSTYAEQRRAQKRGGGVACVSLSGVDMPATTSTDCSEMLAAMDTALRRLEKHTRDRAESWNAGSMPACRSRRPRQLLGMSSRTVKRDWAFAQAWLKRELEEMIDVDRGRAERLEELFDRGLPLDPAERRSLLDDVRRGDAELADELASLFTAHEAPGRLEDLAAQLFPDVLDDLSRTLAGNVENLPSVVGHYQLLEPLGQGGMGEVYRARDLSLDRLVALKFLAPHLAADAEARARLKREARAASALDHPNIAVVHEIGTTAVEPDGSGAGRLFIAMAYYSGETIKKKLTRGSLAVADAIDYAAQTADGLAAAHEAGIVHRDIKPANVIVTSRGVAKIVDFGIARSAGSGLTGDGGLLGTIAYMSPEQTRGEPVDCRTDVWSLGAMVYRCSRRSDPSAGMTMRWSFTPFGTMSRSRCFASDRGFRPRSCASSTSAWRRIRMRAFRMPERCWPR